MNMETMHRARHWDAAYRDRGHRGVSWFEAEPKLSLELIGVLGISSDTAVVDVGGGASYLADRLVSRGFRDVTVLDVSEEALVEGRRRIGTEAAVSWLHDDVLTWHPRRRYGLWHDRAVFHFLTDPRDRKRYLDCLSAAIEPGGGVIVATFAEDGPEYCSGLPVSRYSATELSLTVGAWLEPVEVRRELHTTPWGTTQPFTWLAARAVSGI